MIFNIYHVLLLFILLIIKFMLFSFHNYVTEYLSYSLFCILYRKRDGKDTKICRDPKSSWKIVKIYYYGLICKIKELNYCYIQLLC